MKNPKVISKLGSLLTHIPLLKRKEPETTDKPKVSVKELEHNGITWIDIENPNRKDLYQITEKYSFHPLHLDACVAKSQIDRIELEDTYIFILLHTPRYNRRENRITIAKTCLFLGKKFLITVHKGQADIISRVFAEASDDEIKRDELFKKSAGFLLFQILEDVIKDVTALHESVLSEVVDIEDLVFDVNTSGVYEITQIRQKLVKLKRVLIPFKTIVQGLADDTSEMTPALTRQFTYLSNELNKLRESLDEAKEVIEIYKDADFTVSTERTNKILGILTILFTLAIPAQVLGSFFGMNVFVPGGVESGPLLFWGTFTTFYLIMAGALIPAAVMLFYFKKKKWF